MTTTTTFAIHGGLDSLRMRHQVAGGKTVVLTITTPEAYGGSLVLSGSLEEMERHAARVTAEVESARRALLARVA